MAEQKTWAKALSSAREDVWTGPKTFPAPERCLAAGKYAPQPALAVTRMAVPEAEPSVKAISLPLSQGEKSATLT